MSNRIFARISHLWRDDGGFVISAELVLVMTIGVLSMVVGLHAVSRSITQEFSDISNAFGALDQSYGYMGLRKSYHAWVMGSAYADRLDACDCTVITEIIPIPKVDGPPEPPTIGIPPVYGWGYTYGYGYGYAYGYGYGFAYGHGGGYGSGFGYGYGGGAGVGVGGGAGVVVIGATVNASGVAVGANGAAVVGAVVGANGVVVIPGGVAIVGASVGANGVILGANGVAIAGAVAGPNGVILVTRGVAFVGATVRADGVIVGPNGVVIRGAIVAAHDLVVVPHDVVLAEIGTLGGPVAPATPWVPESGVVPHWPLPQAPACAPHAAPCANPACDKCHPHHDLPSHTGTAPVPVNPVPDSANPPKLTLPTPGN